MGIPQGGDEKFTGAVQCVDGCECRDAAMLSHGGDGPIADQNVLVFRFTGDGVDDRYILDHQVGPCGRGDGDKSTECQCGFRRETVDPFTHDTLLKQLTS